MSTYKLFPSRAALRGSLSKDYPPVLTVNPGDTVAFQTLEADWRIRETDFKASEEGDFFTQRTERDAGHALCGPVAIRGARPGMALAVTVESIVPDTWGWSRVGGGDPDHLRRIGFSGAEYFLRWQIDVENRVCVSQRGHRVRMNPFMGVFAVAPAEVASARTHLPDRFGANLDCKEIVPGSTLYLPVFAEGALFSTGDGHAAQGDGECGCTAIECPMREVRLQFGLSDWEIERPVCKTPAGWITFGFAEDLTDAAYIALRDMAKLMQKLFGYSPKEALALCSVAVDLRITQIVNGRRGVHAMLREDAILKP
ncbi:MULTISPECIES: acetamidase/formamidase family protein [Anaerotruncus]|jgi:acetamidase/formamidase|uniref:acetamidase/formamidase family protein n=1 Tax=Anaerotruncus TaxID=244127 RepID=UPI000E545F30|nr:MULTISPECIES: acetamidase/formamidase family protein [Anaerotruncus]RGX55200.1 acetamidase [Anaerotruncus sp. AF02-27]